MMNLNYIKIGQSSTHIVLVHGWASSRLMWGSITENLALPVTWWAVDLPGHGDSPLPGEPLTIDDHVTAVIDFIDQHEIKPQVIMGHSTGGLITLKIAHKRPGLLRQMVLISPVVTGRFGYQGVLSDILRTEAGIKAWRKTKDIWPRLQESKRVERLFENWIGPAYIKRLVEDDFMAVSPDAGIETLVSMAKETMEQHLTSIKHPALVAVGTLDFSVPPTEGQTAASKLPNGELASFENAMHFPHDQQTEKFIPVLRDFLERYGIRQD